MTSQAVRLSEPAQRAILVHDGESELLILQTDVRSDSPTKVVEFLPLPSEPRVSLAPEDAFEVIGELAGRNRMGWVDYRRTDDSRARGAGPVEAVRLVSSTRLGPHAITVTEVEDVDGFLRWIGEFFHRQDLGPPRLDEHLRTLVESCLRRGIRFFAFDVISPTEQLSTVQPVAYEFATRRLYYPLEVTNLYGGFGTVELFLLVPEAWPSPAGAVVDSILAGIDDGPGGWGLWRSTRARVEVADQRRIHPLVPELLGFARRSSTGSSTRAR